jgi:hypothetical protein
LRLSGERCEEQAKGEHEDALDPIAPHSGFLLSLMSWRRNILSPALERTPQQKLEPNATLQVREIAGARHERTLFPVTCKRLILIEAPSSAYHRGMLALGKQPSEEEETS